MLFSSNSGSSLFIMTRTLEEKYVGLQVISPVAPTYNLHACMHHAFSIFHFLLCLIKKWKIKISLLLASRWRQDTHRLVSFLCVKVPRRPRRLRDPWKSKCPHQTSNAKRNQKKWVSWFYLKVSCGGKHITVTMIRPDEQFCFYIKFNHHIHCSFCFYSNSSRVKLWRYCVCSCMFLILLNITVNIFSIWFVYPLSHSLGTTHLSCEYKQTSAHVFVSTVWD